MSCAAQVADPLFMTWWNEWVLLGQMQPVPAINNPINSYPSKQCSDATTPAQLAVETSVCMFASC